ncbi:MAG: hypothetical protein U1E27_03295, partial [Kiritimatiellia bacterium]|nr:hypothetical protein [Kiritimatiellia bacterium]
VFITENLDQVRLRFVSSKETDFLLDDVTVERVVANQRFEKHLNETNATDWTWWMRDTNKSLGSATSVAGGGRNGTRGVKILHQAPQDWAWTCVSYIPMDWRKHYEFSAWVKGPSDNASIRMQISGYSNTTVVTWAVKEVYVGTGSEWRKVVVPVSLPQGSNINRIRVRFIGLGAHDEFWVDDIGMHAVAPEWPEVNGWAQTRVQETLDRGAVAMELDAGGSGKVYINWRLLKEDASNIGFDVFRKIGGAAETKLNATPIVTTADFTDTNAPTSNLTNVLYTVRPATGFSGSAGAAQWTVRAASASTPYRPPYVRIPLQFDPQASTNVFSRIGVGDLDGDGRLDFVIKHPNVSIDPHEDYWYPSPEPYQLDAYLANGTKLWSKDLGWSIETGIWYSPYLVADLNGNGRAEVIAKIGVGDPRDPDGRVKSGSEYVVVWDGLTGAEITRIEWIPRDGFPSYNHASRNQLAVAYLDGKTPCLLVLRGTYSRMLVDAYLLQNGALVHLWSYDNEWHGQEFWGQGAHFTQAADLTGDGRDEVVLGSVVLKPNGTPLWTTGRGHPDVVYLADILPDEPGLEMAKLLETAQPAGGGMLVVSATTGQELWKLEEPTTHVHSRGMLANVDPTLAGPEFYGAHSDNDHQLGAKWLFSSQGDLLKETADLPGWDFNRDGLYWDADLHKELRVGSRIFKYEGDWMSDGISGTIVLIADLFGDWREEIVVSFPGEIRIYTSPIPAMDRRVCLLQDDLYRQAVRMASMGYWIIPTLPSEPEQSAPNLNLTWRIENLDSPQLRAVVSAPANASVQGTLTVNPGAPFMAPAPVSVSLQPGERDIRVFPLSMAGDLPPGSFTNIMTVSLNGPAINLNGQTRGVAHRRSLTWAATGGGNFSDWAS